MEAPVSEFEDTVSAICAALRRNGWRLATAESCTGGGIAAAVTDVAGVSDVFAGGVVTYSNAFKHQLLGVTQHTLAACGAVSEQTAHDMTAGLTARYGVEAGVAVTGIAGPGGGTVDKPVGLVYVGTAVNADICVTRQLFTGNRRQIRCDTIRTALRQLYNHLIRKGYDNGDQSSDKQDSG